MQRKGRATLAAMMVGLLAGCGGSGSTGDVVRIGAYSVVKEALQEGLLPAFAKHWKAKTGRDVTFEESYNPSGKQARDIKAGQPSDVAILSLEDDMDLLVKAGLVKSTWNAGPTKGMLTNSLVVIGFRVGNPKQIAGWADLAKPGVGVLYPDPKTSGGAKWNVGAIYGDALRRPGADAKSVSDTLASIQKNVVNMDASGRQSVSTFERGSGDALVTYENELLLRKRAGKPIPFVIPPATLVIESPAALVDTNVDAHKNREVAEAFLAFLLSPEGQSILADFGFRPVDGTTPDKTGRPMPMPKGAFRIGDLGGWPKVNADVFGPKGAWTGTFLK